MNDYELKQLEQLIHGLHEGNKIPEKVIPASSAAYRVQFLGYPTGHHFGCPKKPKELGRFNDSGEVYGVWYGAEHPSGALAETFGRLRPPEQKGLGIFISIEDLETREMCVVETVRDLRLLDLNACLSKLNRTLDEVTGGDYGLTQAIVSIVARLELNPFDGIAYQSRHNPDGRMCYALWTAPGQEPTVSTVNRTVLSEFEHHGETPSYFDGDVMDTEEILTEMLGYKVVAP
jgi:hypothetical protein